MITTGFALFSMFFGAGNIIFPLLIGKSVGKNIWFAISGLGITAVIVPFLGLAAMVLFQADYHRFFQRVGRVPGLLLLLLLQLILGPVGVIPRLITLMHAMAKPYLFNIPLTLFSLFTVAAIFGCCFKRQRLIGFLGIILTPILLLALAALLFFGLAKGASMNPTAPAAGESFLAGLLGGYNTMDLIAAFLFATVILPHFQNEIALEQPAERNRALFKKMFFSSLIAASLLFFTYVGLGLISAHHGWTIDPSYPSEQLLSAIAFKVLGRFGTLLASITMVTACLTTAISLATIFADYLRKDLCKEKISPTLALIITLIISMLFSNLGFGGIAAFLGPILQIVYPGLILLTVLNLLHSLYGYQMVKSPVFLTFTISAIAYIFSIL